VSYLLVKTLRLKLGFGWNDVDKKVEATDEVWDAFLAVCSSLDMKHIQRPIFVGQVQRKI
jgi:hypothetical protein